MINQNKGMKLKNYLVPAALLLSVSAFGSPMTDEQYANFPVYTGDDLELKVDSKGTHFTLWSPQADAEIGRASCRERVF